MGKTLQISPTFTLDLTASENCDICLGGATVTTNPGPINGYYLPNTTVEVCLVIDSYTQIAVKLVIWSNNGRHWW